MSLPKSQHLYKVNEYLTFEREAETRHEYLDGFVYAMAGESPEHSLICTNIIIGTGTLIRGGPCAVFSPNMKVRAGKDRLFAYPDVTIVCGEPIFHDKRRDIITNPIVIFEVLSPSEAYDRGDKSLLYRYNESLRDYILVSQKRSFVDHMSRQPNGEWIVRSIEGLDGILHIESIDVHLKLSDIYERITFEPDSTPIQTNNSQ